MLCGIHLSNFGVLQDTTVGMTLADLRGARGDGAVGAQVAEICPMRPFLALIGRNSTGKSSLFDALSFLADIIRHGVQDAATMHDRGGYARLLTAGGCRIMRFDLLLELEEAGYYVNYSLSLTCDDHGRPHIAFEQVIRIDKPADGGREQILLDLAEGEGFIVESGTMKPAGITDRIYPALAAYGLIRAYPELQRLYSQITHWYVCRLRRNGNEPAEQRMTGGHKHLNANCDNVVNVLKYYREELPDIYRQIIRHITARLPEGKPPDDAFLNGEMKSGSLKLFTLLLLLEDPQPRPLICLEEPDAGLYHDMVDTLALAMREFTMNHPGCQILYTTHNPYILESMNPDEVWVFERHAGPGELAAAPYAKARCVGQDPLVRAMYKQGVGMGALWYGGHFDKQEE